MVSIGQLNRRITFQSISIGSDGAGGQIEDPARVDVKTVWARIKPLSGRKKDLFGLSSLEETFEITIRREALTPLKSYVFHDGIKTYEILGIKEDEDRKEWSIAAKVIT